MNKIYLITLGLAFGFSACQQKNSTENQSPADYSEAFVDHHTAEISLDYWGTYKGVLPCASCPGIETTLVLNQDHTFSKTSFYLEKGDQPFVEKGTYSIQKNRITLSGTEDGPHQYLVGENFIKQLDAEGKEIEGSLADHYLLIKEPRQH